MSNFTVDSCQVGTYLGGFTITTYGLNPLLHLEKGNQLKFTGVTILIFANFHKIVKYMEKCNTSYDGPFSKASF